MISPIKYLTFDDLTAAGIVSKLIRRDRAYSVVDHTLMGSMVRVAVSFGGAPHSFDMPKSTFDSLVEIPTHDSVADLPRLDVRKLP